MKVLLVIYIFSGAMGSMGGPGEVLKIDAPDENSCQRMGEKMKRKLEALYHRTVTFECLKWD